jgi:hypothetical protein
VKSAEAPESTKVKKAKAPTPVRMSRLMMILTGVFILLSQYSKIKKKVKKLQVRGWE